IVGLGLSQIGEFSFVLARTGVTSRILSKPTYDLALTCTVLTMALSPLAANLALPMRRASGRWRKPARAREGREAVTGPQGHIIVAGYGRRGKAAARVLQRAEIPLIVVEIDHSVFGGLAPGGLSGIWGDITGDEILKAAQIENARVLLATVPDQSTIRLSVE